MKRLFLFLFLLGSLSSFSQIVNNLVMFCNEAEPFTLILNGERINMTPQTRVKAENLTVKKYQTKIIFQNPRIKEANTVITFFGTGNECEFILKKKGKRKYRIEYFTERKIPSPSNPQ